MGKDYGRYGWNNPVIALGKLGLYKAHSVSETQGTESTHRCKPPGMQGT